MSTTRLMVLGLVRWLQPVHGYDVRKELLSWEVDRWANVQPGSIYHALRKLAEEGLLEEVATEQVGARPARTTYRLTEAGEREFQSTLREYWSGCEPPVDPFMSAFSFLPVMSRTEAADALRRRAAELEKWADYLRLQLTEPYWHESKPAHVTWHIELMLVRNEADVRWCHDVAARIDAGEGMHEGEYDPVALAEQWRKDIQANEQ